MSRHHLIARGRLPAGTSGPSDHSAPRAAAGTATAEQPPKGATLIAVIACLAVASMMLSSMAQRMLLARQQLRNQAAYHQARWLCTSGLQRATYRLQRDPDYTGETWRVDASQLNEHDAGEVTIAVQPHGDTQWRIDAVAHYPAGQHTAVQYSHTVRIPVGHPAAEPADNTHSNFQEEDP